MRWLWQICYVLIPSLCFGAGWVDNFFTNAYDWDGAVTFTATVQNVEQIIIHSEGTNADAIYTNAYFVTENENVSTNETYETDGSTYTNTINITTNIQQENVLLYGQDAALWQCFESSVERNNFIVGFYIHPNLPYFKSRFVENVDTIKRFINRTVNGYQMWVCLTNEDVSGHFPTELVAGGSYENFVMWNTTNLLEHNECPSNFLSYTPFWNVEREVTNSYTIRTSSTNTVTNAVYFNGFETNMIGTNGQVLNSITLNTNVHTGFTGKDYYDLTRLRNILDDLVYNGQILVVNDFIQTKLWGSYGPQVDNFYNAYYVVGGYSENFTNTWDWTARNTNALGYMQAYVSASGNSVVRDNTLLNVGSYYGLPDRLGVFPDDISQPVTNYLPVIDHYARAKPWPTTNYASEAWFPAGFGTSEVQYIATETNRFISGVGDDDWEIRIFTGTLTPPTNYLTTHPLTQGLTNTGWRYSKGCSLIKLNNTNCFKYWNSD